jgi:small subunit ribosomal protein S18
MFEERRRRVIDDVTPVDWKNAEWLRRFITENGRILPRRIKRARHMALLPFGRQSEY